MYMTGSTHWVSKERAEELAGFYVDGAEYDLAAVRPQPDSDCYEVWYLSSFAPQAGQAEFKFSDDDVIYANGFGIIDL